MIMTEKLYYTDSHIKEFDAAVIGCKNTESGFAVCLDKTAFFPEGGGQTSDTGFINGIRVFDVKIIDGVIYHYTEQPLKTGDTVHGVIDWEKRFDFMQQHSGEHIVSGIANRLFGCENVGFHLSCDIVTVDFDINLNHEQILKIETEANKVIYNNAKFKAYFPTADELASVSYRSKKELDGDIRLVEIENTDICACCAPHVDFASEIGIIKLLDCEKLRGGVRIEMKCGKRALYDYNDKYDNIRRISNLLAVKQTDAADGVDRLYKNISELKFTITELRKDLINYKTDSFRPENFATALFEEKYSIKELQLFADALHKKHVGIRAVFSKADNGFAFAVCGEESRLSDWFSEFKQRFEVKGGGRNGMIQGTVIAEKQDIIDFFGDLVI